ncbi:MAG: Coenzyme F420 hydrogenase/dehydrogenase, beta subunit C-terminal domain [Planctomycetaceae bacterium]|nr:Coenzyme F420 hydrogenase/dehydrogenase, beta subunit C-terminal domain [Planctomycetaceae bacterium]
MKLYRVDQVRRWRLCSGCGACASACPENNIWMQDVVQRGLRPFLKSQDCRYCGTCVSVCPGAALSHARDVNHHRPEWGPVLKLWEGYAVNPDIRFKGSSGGAATAIAHYCLKHEPIHGVLQTKADENNPIANTAVLSRTYEDLLAGTGSRYSPAAPCERLYWLKVTNGPCVFVGKPCDTAALAKYANVFAAVRPNMFASISIFCAGTPSTQGTLEILDRMGIEKQQLASFRYRGNGWPGSAVAEGILKEQYGQLTYSESWGNILSKHVPFRCRICPDSSGEFADISCGDPWYRPIEPDDPGRSLVIARTEKGLRLVEKAIAAGYLALEEADARIIGLSQKSLLNKRRQLWGRITTMRLSGVPVPDYKGFGLFASWLKLSWREKFKSIAGTGRRILARRWYLPDPQESNP